MDRRRLVTAGKRLARVAGGLYLLMVALGGIAQLGVRAGIRVPGHAATTPRDITAVSPAADLVMATMVAFIGFAAYLLLRHIDRRPAGTRVVFVAVGVGMMLVNLAFHHAAQLVAADPASTLVAAQGPDGLVVLLLDMHDHGYRITGAFFGLWLLALGHLAYQSSVFPRPLSTLLIVSLVVSALVGFGLPGLPAVVHTILAPHPVAELWLVAYLVTKGVPARRPDQRAPTAVSA